MVGTGAVVTERDRRPRADEHRSGGTHPGGHGGSVGGLDLEVLGRVGVDHAQALSDVVVLEHLISAGPVLGSGQAERKLGNHITADHAHKIGDDGKQRQHDTGGDHARRHQLLNRVRPESAHGVDLLGDAHGAKFAGDSRRISSRHQQRREHRT